MISRLLPILMRLAYVMAVLAAIRERRRRLGRDVEAGRRERMVASNRLQK